VPEILRLGRTVHRRNVDHDGDGALENGTQRYRQIRLKSTETLALASFYQHSKHGTPVLGDQGGECPVFVVE
jgi:hypothetical protein